MTFSPGDCITTTRETWFNRTAQPGEHRRHQAGEHFIVTKYVDEVEYYNVLYVIHISGEKLYTTTSLPSKWADFFEPMR